VNFKGKPDILQIKLFFQLIDNTFADIAEGSYVVGKNADGNTHKAPFHKRIMYKIYKIADFKSKIRNPNSNILFP